MSIILTIDLYVNIMIVSMGKMDVMVPRIDAFDLLSNDVEQKAARFYLSSYHLYRCIEQPGGKNNAKFAILPHKKHIL